MWTFNLSKILQHRLSLRLPQVLIPIRLLLLWFSARQTLQATAMIVRLITRLNLQATGCRVHVQLSSDRAARGEAAR